jgi:hypothetical protein
MGHNSERLEFQSVLESFGWKPVISASEFTHPDYSSHYITVYPGSAIHSYAEYPWGSMAIASTCIRRLSWTLIRLSFTNSQNGRKTQLEI